MIARPSINQPLSRPDRFNFSHSLLELLQTSRPRTIRLAVISVALAWLPALILSAMHGLNALKSFLLDFAAQSRLLVVIPLLILTEPELVARLDAVAQHFLEAELVTNEDLAQFDYDFRGFKRRGDSVIAQIAIVLLIYTFVAYALPYIRLGSLEGWCYLPDNHGDLALAGFWYVFISLPLGLYLMLRCVWRQLAWSWFLRSVSHLDLRLIPAHPDRMAGLGFLETCLHGYIPFAFAIGIIVSGGVANRVIHLHYSLLRFKYFPLLVVAIVIVLCVGPLCNFFGLLLRTRRRGVFEYGGLASGLGHEFEQKWLGPDAKVDRDVLEKPDFSATIDLYSVAAYVQQIKFFPVSVVNLAQLAAAALIPAIPIALFAMPFDVILKATVKFLI